VYGGSSFFSLNAELQRSDLAAAERVLRALAHDIQQHGLDPETWRRLQLAAVAKQVWAVQGNSALATYYWNALGDYHEGHFRDPAKQLQAVSLEQANEAIRLLFRQPGYIRLEQPLLSVAGLYWLIGAVAAALLLLILAWRRRKA
jgi:hypothetical protein